MKAALLIMAALLVAGCDKKEVPRDSTDPPDGRSGLDVYIDHATGCQYLGLGNRRYVLTPRLDAQGRPMCGSTDRSK